MNRNPSPLAPRPSPLALRVIGLVWVVGFVVWFYSFTLPNGKLSDGTPISRLDVWLNLPELLLENVSPSREAGAPPSGWRFLLQRFDLLAVAGLILAGAWGLGQLVLRLLRLHAALDHVERTVFAFGLGLSGLSLLTMICGVAGMLNRWALGGALAGFLAAEISCRWRTRRAAGDRAKRQPAAAGPREFSLAACLTVACVTPFLMAMLLGAMLPPTDFDVKEYHLQGPKEYFLQGRVTFLPHNVYTSFPFLTEMLSLLAMVLRDDWFRGALAGKVVLMAFAPLTAAGLFAAGRRWFTPTVGWLCVLVHLTIPWIYRISIIAYVEGGLTFFLFATLLAVLIWWSERDDARSRGLLLLAGLLAGSAVACKYPGVLSVAIPLGATVVLRAIWTGRQDLSTAVKRGGAAAVLFGMGTFVTFGPWMLKNIAETGNPVYPLLYTVFGGEDLTEELNEKWRNGHRPPVELLEKPSKIPGDLARHAIDVAAQSDWQSPLIFAWAPLALLCPRRRRMVGGLWVYVLWLFFTWWGLTHRIDRFWIPLLPIASWLAGVGLGWLLGVPSEETPVSDHKPTDGRRPLANPIRRAGEGIVVVGLCTVVMAAVLFNLGFATSALCGYNAYLIDLETATRDATTPSIRVLNELPLPADARVLFVGEAQVFDARFDHVYNTVFDESLFQRWTSAAVPGLSDAEQPFRPRDEILATLAEHGITHVFVNWREVERYRNTYGYTEFVTPARFRELAAAGVLREIPLDPRWGFQLFVVQRAAANSE